MNRGFIQLPILFAILASIALFGGVGYIEYKASQKSSIQTEKTVIELTTATPFQGSNNVPTTSPIEINNDATQKEISSQQKTMTSPIVSQALTPSTTVRTDMLIPAQIQTPTSTIRINATEPTVATITPDKVFSIVVIKLGNIIVTQNSAQISWVINVPVASKITITKMPTESNANTAQYLPSANGISIKGIASIVGLEQNTEYAYTIEAGTDNPIKLDGKFTTEKSAEQISRELEEAKVQKMKDAINRDGYYISCNEDKSLCTKTTDGFCWSESLNGHPFTGRSCGS